MIADLEKPVVDLAARETAGRAEEAGRPPSWRAARAEWSLRELVQTLRRGRRLVLGGALAGLGAAAAYLALATPIYTARVLVQIEDRSRTPAGLEDLAGILGGKTPAEAELEVLRSRTLLGSVVDQLALDLRARPRTFPLLGAALARWHQGPALAAAPLRLERFAWGGERIAVTRLDVPDALLGAPLTLVALGDGRYELRDDEGLPWLRGAVGAVAESADGALRLLVSELTARPGTEFIVERARRSAAIDELERRLEVYEPVKKTGMLALELSGPSPSREAATLSAVASTYLRQNVDRMSAEAVKTLAFLESQLPIVQSSLNAAESRLGSYQRTKGTVDPSKEIEGALARSAAIEQALSALEVERSELEQQYTDTHPILLGLTRKLEELRGERAALEERLRGLPATALETARLERDVKVGSEMYVFLLNKAQEYRVMKSGTVSNVRIVDQAEVPWRPSRPRPAPAVVVGLLLGLVVGVGLAMARRALSEVLDDPLELERATGLPVYAAIPYSRAEAALRRTGRPAGAPWAPLALAAPQDPAVESLRTLRSALPSLPGTRGKLVVISSAAPGAGKSFVAINLAVLLASAERRVLLVDADLRGGRLHQHFGYGCQPGLSDLIRGTTTVAEVTRHPEGTGLGFVGRGTASPSPAELLSSPRLIPLLAEMAAGHDFVVVDTAPVLAVSDPFLLAQLAGATLLVVEAARDTLPDLRSAMSRFAQRGAQVRGAILNGTTRRPSSYERYSRYTSAYTARRSPT